MCGISGYNWSDSDLIGRMMKSMQTRGPDDSGSFVDDKVTMGHVRLSILDTSIAGHQPMYGKDKESIIVYNGEIYNSPEIRVFLQNKGYKFNSSTDTEVILHSYRYWGESFIKKLRGMFAFVIYIPDESKFFIARDHAGIKPLYYYHKKSKFIFSSTISSFFNHDIKKTPNSSLIRDYLLYNTTDHSSDTFFKNINKFPKGHYATFNLSNGKLKLYKWWENKYTGTFSGSQKEAATKIRYLLKKSVSRHLLSDVSVGTSLSGGIDSSSIVSLINSLNITKMKTFSAVFPGFSKDETQFINLICDSENLVNYKINLNSGNLAKDISDFIRFNEEPLPTPSPYAQYKVFELAKKKTTTVLLDGQGADELFAGYPYFYGFLIKGLLRKRKFFSAFREMIQLLGSGFYKIGIFSIFFLLLPISLQKSYFAKRTCASISLIEDKRYETDFFKKYYSCSSLHEALQFHLDYKLEHLLKWGDRNSMAHSRESRVPFLDPDFMKFVFTLPENFILSGGRTKLMLRYAMYGFLPNQISDRRDKIGFSTPENSWLRDSSMRSQLDNLLFKVPLCAKYINLKKVRIMIEKVLKGDIEHTREIWKIIFLENWMKINNLKS